MFCTEIHFRKMSVCVCMCVDRFVKYRVSIEGGWSKKGIKQQHLGPIGPLVCSPCMQNLT